MIDGVFLTHAHIGHYAGLMYFGREALGKKDVSVPTLHERLVAFLFFCTIEHILFPGKVLFVNICLKLNVNENAVAPDT